jgi:asparagine synthase (glutamine-hydrolysing)
MYMPFFSRFRRLEAVLDAEYFQAFQPLDRASLLLNNTDVMGRLTDRAPVHQSLYLWGKTMLPGYILALLGDRMEMAHSIEGRVPLLDHKVAEFLFRTPVRLKIHGLTEKYILREATRDVLTDSAYRRQKHPFAAPPETSAKPSRMTALIQDSLRSDTVEAVPFLNAGAVRALADRLPGMAPAERGRIDADLMTLLSYIFLQERLIETGAAVPSRPGVRAAAQA